MYDTIKVNEKLNYLFSSKLIFDEIYSKFSEINADYCDEFQEVNDVDYGTMIKGRKIDSELLIRYFRQKKKDAERYNWTYFREYIS